MLSEEERRKRSREGSRKWRELHPNYQAEWRLRNPSSYKAGMFKGGLARIGLTVAQYENLLSKQNGVCALCKQPPKRIRLAVDHDHKCCPGDKICGKCIRGLLCSTCNVYVVGHLERQKVNPLELYVYLQNRVKL